jgi:hypothetical protein
MTEVPPDVAPADWAAQHLEVVPDAVDDEELLLAHGLEVDLADLAEQARVVPEDDGYDR